MPNQWHKVHWQEMSDTEDEHHSRRRPYRELWSWENCVLNLDKPSRSSINSRISNSPPAYSLVWARVSTTDFIAAVESGNFDIVDTAIVNYVPYNRVCSRDSHRASKYTQIRDLKAFDRKVTVTSTAGGNDKTATVAARPLKLWKTALNATRMVNAVSQRNKGSDSQIARQGRHMEDEFRYRKSFVAEKCYRTCFTSIKFFKLEQLIKRGQTVGSSDVKPCQFRLASTNTIPLKCPPKCDLTSCRDV